MGNFGFAGNSLDFSSTRTLVHFSLAVSVVGTIMWYATGHVEDISLEIRRANLMVKFTEVLNHPIKSPVGFRFGDVIVPHKPVVFPTFLPFAAPF